MRLFDNLYKSVSGVTLWTADFFNGIHRSVDERLHKLEERDLTVDGIVGNIVADTQKAVQNVFDPAVATILRMQEAGFLIGSSSTLQTLIEGQAFTFVMDEGDSRELFTPSIYTVATRTETPDFHAVLRTIRYDRSSGAYAFEVVSIVGVPGAYDDWIVGALAGPALAQIDYLGQGKTARDTTLAARSEIETFTTTATQAALTATSERQTTSGLRLAASNDADRADRAADRAETFDPAMFYQKSETRTRGEITTEIAAAVSGLIEGAPGALDTLNELAASLGDDANFAATIANSMATERQARIDADALKLNRSSKASGGQVQQQTDDTSYVTPAGLGDAMSFESFARTSLNLSGLINGTITLSANTTLLAPIIYGKEGQSGVLAIAQDATGSRTLGFASAYDFGAAGVPTLSTAPGATDYIFYVVKPGANGLLCTFRAAA